MAINTNTKDYFTLSIEIGLSIRVLKLCLQNSKLELETKQHKVLFGIRNLF